MHAGLIDESLGEITIRKGTRVGQVERVEEESVAVLITTDIWETQGHTSATPTPEKRQMLWSMHS